MDEQHFDAEYHTHWAGEWQAVSADLYRRGQDILSENADDVSIFINGEQTSKIIASFQLTASWCSARARAHLMVLLGEPMEY